MAHIQYHRNVTWSTELQNLGTDQFGLAVNGEKTTAGAPSTDAERYQVACMIQNTNDGFIYVNHGTVAIPVWGVITVV